MKDEVPEQTSQQASVGAKTRSVQGKAVEKIPGRWEKTNNSILKKYKKII